MRRVAAVLVGLLAISACGDRSPIPAEYLMVEVSTDSPEVTLGVGFPVTVRRIWSKDLEPSEFTDLERSLQADPHFGRVEPMRLTTTDNEEILFQLRFDYYAEVDAVEEQEAEPPETGEVAEEEPAAPEKEDGSAEPDDALASPEDHVGAA